jgi:hypothetical protein
MIMKRNIFIKSIGLLLLLALVSCNKDGDLVTVGRGDALTLDGSNNIVLDPSNAIGLALTLHWNDNHVLNTNYVDVLVPDGSISNTLQISKTEDFASCYSLNMSNGVYQKQFTNAELNGELTKLGYEPYAEQPMYVRVASTTGANIEPQYSNVLEMTVVPYKIDYTYAIAMSKDKATELGYLYSPTENGIYTGFLALGGWGNWWLMENDGTTWGNTPVDGSVFNITNTSDAWNLWSSGFNGCRYVTVNTKQKFWNELSIPSVTVSGDITGDMTFNKEKKQWTLVYTAESTSPVTLQFSSPDSRLYNTTTGDAEDSGISTPLYFTSEGVSTDAAENITVAAPQAGECTLIIDLSGEKPLYTIEEGSAAPPEELSPVLCIMGNDDKWDHTEWLRLSDEDSKTYTSAVNMKSSWGFYFTKTLDDGDWDKINQDPDTSDKKLKAGGNDIAAPGEGLYILSASLGWMSYWYEMDGAQVETVSYTGLNDSWEATAMTATETPGVYTATVNVTADTPWGMQILINGSWDYWFGTRSDGTLTWKAKDNGNPAGIDGNGTYTLTVDICHGTYSFTK